MLGEDGDGLVAGGAADVFLAIGRLAASLVQPEGVLSGHWAVAAAATVPFAALPTEPGDGLLVRESDICIGARVLLVQASELRRTINIIHKYHQTATISPVALTFS